MNNRYHIYCDGILGVKTNVNNFKWVYGSVAPNSSYGEYEKCKVKFDICVKPEKLLSPIGSPDRRFQCFSWNDKNKTVSYRRTFFKYLRVGYDIKVDGNVVSAEIGENYYRLIKNRVMNLHGIYYLLSDIANIILLSNGYLTMYSAAVYNKSTNRGAVCFGAPNTGKTFTATKLCENPDYYLVGEDMVISDGRKLYSCPWTTSYRNNKCKDLDSAGSLKRTQNSAKLRFIELCELTDIVVLSLGKEEIGFCKKDISSKACLINGYLFNYYSSPIVKILGFFDDSFCIPWQEQAETMLKNIVENSNCLSVQLETASGFADKIHSKLFGE